MYNKKIPVDVECGFRVAMEVIGGKWKPYIVYEMLDGPKRPSELKRHIAGASDRVLTQQLRELVEYGVVEKCIISNSLKHSEYHLTELGKTLIPIIEGMRNWGNGFRDCMKKILAEKCKERKKSLE